jgi:hypothetical protein
MCKKGYYVNIFRGSKNDDFLLIRCKGYYAKISKTCIEEYNLTVNNSNMFISKELYENWFKEGIEADREKERKRKEIFDSFYPHIPLFWKNREMILKEPRYYSVRSPFYFMGAAYIGSSLVTLGELLQIWERETVFSVTCRDCGGKRVVFNFSGSPLSGALGLCENICLQCGKIGNGSGAKSFGGLRNARLSYKPLQPIAENPATYKELIAACKSETYIAENENNKENVEFEDDRFFGMTIGNRRIALSDLFTSKSETE